MSEAKGEQKSTETLSFRCDCERCRFMRGRIHPSLFTLKKRREQLSSFSSSKLGAGIGLSSQAGATHVALFSNICSLFFIHVFVPPSIFTEVRLYEPVRMDSAEQND